MVFTAFGFDRALRTDSEQRAREVIAEEVGADPFDVILQLVLGDVAPDGRKLVVEVL